VPRGATQDRREKGKQTMTDDAGSTPAAAPLTTKLGIENTRTVIVAVDQVIVVGERRAINETMVAQLVESIKPPGRLLNPITVRKAQDGGESLRLVAGLHRLEAKKRLGIATIECIVLEHDDDLRAELAEIDENLIRNDLSPAQHAILTGHRVEVLRELAERDGTASQDETASRQARRRAGERTGPEPASLRDQANKTGKTKDSIYRSQKRFENIGGDILKRISGTCLDKGVQLDALAKRSKVEQYDLAERAAAGEKVSARKKRNETSSDPDDLSTGVALQHACDELANWINKYSELLEAAGLWDRISEYYDALLDAQLTAEGTEAPEPTGEPPQKKTWRDRMRDRIRGLKGD
jgi:hypothetical protein